METTSSAVAATRGQRTAARLQSARPTGTRGAVILRYAFAALCVTALLGSATVSANQTATGSVVGTVRDRSGAALPNVAITIAGDALMGARTASTAADGNYRIDALPPGDYVLSFSLDGFRTHDHRVSVVLGFTITVDIELGVASHEEQLTVAARSRVLDRQSTAISETLDAGLLADLPGSRSMSALFEVATGVVTSRIEAGGGSVGALGSSGSIGAYGTRGSNRPTIEGIVVSGINAGGLTIDYGSFEQASVLTGSHVPEWATPGVHIQLIARSGGNQYRGTLYADYGNRDWQSFNVDQDQIDHGALSGGGLSAADANRLWRYGDVNADVGGFIVRDRLWWYSSFRDQEISTRLVNFPVEPHQTRLSNYSGKSTYRIAPGHSLVAYVQAARNHQPNGLDPFGPAGSGLVASTAINTGESSTADQHASGLIWKGEWQAVVHDRLLLEVRLGQFGGGQRWTPYSTAPRFEDTQTLVVRGGNRDWQSQLRRDQFFGNVSYFKNSWMGGHHLRLGVEVTRWRAGETWLSAYPGDVLHVSRNGAPAEVYLFHTPSKSSAGLWTYAAHAADSWQPHRLVSLNLGVRFDGYRVFLPEQEHPAGSPTAQRFAAVNNLIDWHVVVPRLGAVFDLTGKGTTLAKVALAQYRVAPGNTVGANSNPNSNQWWTRFEWSDLDNSGVWEPGEEGRRLGRRGGTATESLDAALRLPVVNEFAGWFERELPAGIGLRTGFVRRSERDHFERQNVNQPFEAFTVPVSLRDPGPDGIEGTVDDGRLLAAFDLAPERLNEAPLNIVRNVAGSRSEYLTWEIGAARRLRGGWALGSSFSHTWSFDHASAYSGQRVRGNTYPLTPNDLINTGSGGRHEFTTWTAKAHGTYELPWDVRVTPVIWHQSGQPFGRTFTARLRYGTTTVLAEPIGTRRMDNLTICDLRVEKGFRMARRRLGAFVDVFNVFNANAEQNILWSSGASYLRPIDIVPPRSARIGARVDW
jgi:hypothetical protein